MGKRGVNKLPQAAIVLFQMPSFFFSPLQKTEKCMHRTSHEILNQIPSALGFSNVPLTFFPWDLNKSVSDSYDEDWAHVIRIHQFLKLQMLIFDAGFKMNFIIMKLVVWDLTGLFVGCCSGFHVADAEILLEFMYDLSSDGSL